MNQPIDKKLYNSFVDTGIQIYKNEGLFGGDLLHKQLYNLLYLIIFYIFMGMKVSNF